MFGISQDYVWDSFAFRQANAELQRTHQWNSALTINVQLWGGDKNEEW